MSDVQEIDFDIMPNDIGLEKDISETNLYKRWYNDVAILTTNIYNHLDVKKTPDEANKILNRIIERKMKETKLKAENIEIINNIRHQIKHVSVYDIFEYIDREHLIITDNGAIYVNQDRLTSMHYNFQSTTMEERNVQKKLMFQAKQKGDIVGEQFYFVGQLGTKVAGNGAYGACCMPGGPHYAVDMIGSITGQGRSATSCAITTTEHLLGDNFGFKSPSQLFNYIKIHLKNKVRTYDLGFDVSIDMVYHRLMDKTLFTNDEEMYNTSKVLMVILNGLDAHSLDILYYRNNMIRFMDDCKEIKRLFRVLTSSDVKFIESAKVPDEIQPQMDAIRDLIYTYVFTPYVSYAKQYETLQTPRRVVLYYDTDSCYISLQYYVDYAKKHGMMTESEQSRISYVSAMCNIMDHVFADVLEVFTDGHNNLPEYGKKFVIIKNEFLFNRIIMTKGKKRYLCSYQLQEGTFLADPDYIWKGLNIVKSSCNPAIRRRLKDALKQRLLSAGKGIDRNGLVNDIQEIQQVIIDTIERGEMIFYDPVKTKPASAYAKPWTMPSVVGSSLWSRLYPDNPIGDGGGFKIKLDINNTTLSNCNERVRKIVSDSYEEGIAEIKLGSKKLKWLILPYSSSRVPEEIIPLIDITDIIYTQTKVIKDVLVAINLGSVKVKQIESVGSGIVNPE